MSAPKLCRDCRWYDGVYGCDAPGNVTGVIDMQFVEPARKPILRHRWLTAAWQRGMGWVMARLMRACGREARWWEPRP